MPRTRPSPFRQSKSRPVAIIWAGALCFHESSTPCARTDKHSALGLCHVYGTSNPARGGELSARQSSQSVVCCWGRLTEYSGLCHRHQRERGPNHLLQNLHECGLLSYRYLSFGLLSGEWGSTRNFGLTPGAPAAKPT